MNYIVISAYVIKTLSLIYGAKEVRGMNKFLRLLSDPKFRFSVLAAKGFYKTMPDEEVYKKSYQLSYGKKPDLKHPQGFNEKLMWLKLHDRKPLYTTLVDKYAVRRYIADKVGEEYLIPLLGGPWESADEIDFDALPNQFVLKCTHDSGSVIVCRDKSRFDIEDARRRLSRRLKRNYYYGNREWPYKNVPPRIIAEEFICQGSLSDTAAVEASCISPYALQAKSGIIDYKFMCFNGQPKILYLQIGAIDSSGHSASEKSGRYFRNLYDADFNILPLKDSVENYPIEIMKPDNFALMRQIAEILSAGFPFIRVDMYNVNGEIKIGELTLYPGSGLSNFFDPPEWDGIFGSWIKLPEEQQAALSSL